MKLPSFPHSYLFNQKQLLASIQHQSIHCVKRVRLVLNWIWDHKSVLICFYFIFTLSHRHFSTKIKVKKYHDIDTRCQCHKKKYFFYCLSLSHSANVKSRISQCPIQQFSIFFFTINCLIFAV